MPDRAALIRSIKVGDIFHADCPNGASLVCLATKTTDTIIYARRLLVPEDLEFDRTTGLMRATRHHCPIDSIAPLPPDIREVIENLDYRYNYGPKPVDTKFSKAEFKALVFLDNHYRANPI